MTTPTDPPGDPADPAGSGAGGRRPKRAREERDDDRLIHDLEAADARLRASESRYREFLERAERDQARLAAIVDSSDDAIVSKDLTGTVQTWNGGAERIFGWRADEIVGRSITTIIPEELVAQEEDILERLRSGQRIEHFETVRLAKDGRRVDVSLAISPILDSRRQVIGASKISRDITEAKRMANAMAQADRNKDQFLATLAHELRNPLAVLASAVELLELPDAAGRLDSTRRMMKRQVRHLVHLVDDLMDMSRMSRGLVTLRKRRLDVRKVVEQAVESARSAMEARHHAVEVRLPRGPLAVRGDPTRLEQVLVNLPTNAARFTPPGGRIEVEAGARDGRVVLAVRDNGIGMSAELLANVFEPSPSPSSLPIAPQAGWGSGSRS